MTEFDLAGARNLVQSFDEVVRRHPDRVAVCGGERELRYRELRYRELAADAAALAAAIRSRVDDPTRPVLLLLPRSVDMVVACLAVLRTGAAYVPVDPTAPAARVALIVADCRPSIVVTTAELAHLVPAGTPFMMVDESGEDGPSTAESTIGAGDRAYVIYTSGTTGRPKGVEVSHGNVLRLFATAQPLFRYTSEDVWTLFHSFAFDFSVWEMWGALLSGGRLVVVDPAVARDPVAFRALLADQRVTMLSQTPTAFNSLIAQESRYPDRLPLRWVVFGGEALRFGDLRPWVDKYGDDRPQLVNMYGITETTVHASYRRVRAADLVGTASVIGRPLPDLDFLLWDGQSRPVAPGETGEIIVTGPGVALGYLHNPELTGERFLDLTTADGRPTRGYRSGDLARLTPTGEYEYQGRADDQVKIRGHRIELGEIHAALTAIPGVTRAAVTVRGAQPRRNPVVKQEAVPGALLPVRNLVHAGREVGRSAEGSAQLVAYVVCDDSADPALIPSRLREQLPPYMVPGFVVPVPDIPVNVNGKADFGLLPAPTAANQLRHAAAPEPSAAGADEPGVRPICALFEEVLGLDGVTGDDSFFGIGGDSILAVRLRAAAAARGIGLDLVDIYDLQTPRELAAVAVTDGAHSASTIEPYSLISAADRALLPAEGVVDAYPVAMLQAGVLFHSSYVAGVNMYCDIFMFRLRAGFDRDAMARALARAAARHEILRTSFHLSGYSEPVQIVHAQAQLPLTVTDLTHLPFEQQMAEFDAWRDREAQVAYDWSRPPLVRFAVHLLGEREFMLSMSFHDTMFDGWSETSLLAEIFIDYWRDLTGIANPEASPPVRRYADFIALEQAALRDAATREFWARELAEVEPSVLPHLAPGSADLYAGRMGFLSVDLPAELSDRLHQLAASCRVSVKHVLMAVQARVMMVLTGRDDVVLGVASNGRVEEDGGTEVIGLHLNLVPYRLRPRGRTWRELIVAASDKERELLPMRRFPHAEMLRLIGLPELTDVMFNYTHFHGYERLADATDIEVLDGFGYLRTNFTLRAEFNKDPFSRLLSLDLEANLERLSEQQVQQIADLFQQALTSIVDEPDREPTQERLLGEQQYRALLDASVGPVEPATAATFVDRFDQAVVSFPDRVAAACQGREITYRDLATRVEAVAGWLARRQVRPGTVVGLAAGRDIDYLTVVLAIMRLGAVYLPLPDGPASRVARMVRRADAHLVVCTGTHRAALTDLGGGPELVDLADVLTTATGAAAGPAGPAPGGRRPSVDRSAPAAQDPAYLLFTSGSTGEPKGALIRHDGMLNHLDAKIGQVGLGPGDRLAQDAAATFDISVWQFLAPLAVGATTVIYPDEIGQDAPRLLRAVATDGVTVLEVTPSVLNVMNAELAFHGLTAFPPFALRWVVSQAEALTPQCANTFRRLLPGVGLQNMYGATETSDDCLHHHVAADIDERVRSVPLGRPARNTAVYVLDQAREPVPTGTPGELYVGGICVGDGYVNDPERTAAAFVTDPFTVRSEPAGRAARMYRTGDRGRRLADGAVEFLGRVDNQLKIRGNRVELDEVSRALAGVDGVQESAVTVRSAADGSRQLVGFFVPDVATGGGAGAGTTDATVRRDDLTSEQVRGQLAKVLPRFAIPDFLIGLDALPRTPHGKVDTRALAGIDVSPAGDQVDDAADPMTPTEQVIAEIWASVIRSRQPGPTTNFFDLGGHSLHATQVLARVRDHFGVTLPVRDLFENPTVRGLAARIGAGGDLGSAGAAEQVPVPTRPPGLREFPLTAAQSSLWYLDQLDPDGNSYTGGYLLHLAGNLDVPALEFAVDRLAERHEVLRTRFVDRDGVPFQVVDAEADTEADADANAAAGANADAGAGARLRLRVEDVPAGTVPTDNPEAMLDHVRQQRGDRRFDLHRGPLTVACLHRFSATGYVLEWSSHHAVSDGWSNEVLMRDLAEFYQARVAGRDPVLPALPVQYGDYARWQELFLDSPQAQQDSRFWRSYLDGYPGELTLSTDLDRTEDRSRAAGHLHRNWDDKLSTRVREFARELDATLFMVVHAVGAVLMAKLAQQSDLVIGAAVAGRNLAETRDLVGFFANVVPFRYDIDLSRTAPDTVRLVRDSALNALDHQNLPFQHVVDVAGVPRTPGVSPLVQVVVSVARPLRSAATLAGVATSATELGNPTSRFDLLLHFTDDDVVGLTVEYDRTLFAEPTVARIASAAERLTRFFVEEPDRPLEQADLIDDGDRVALESIWHEVTGQRLDIDHRAVGVLLESPYWDRFVAQVEAEGLLAALVLAL